jgi:nitrate reductase gamma subunit
MTRDQYLFAVVPYLAAASCVAHGFVRVMRGRAGTIERSTGASVIWRWAIAVVLAGHVLALAFPAQTLAWNRAAWRMYALEASGSMAALLALAALGATVVQRRRFSDAVNSGALHTVGDTLVFLALATGAAGSLFYRWASSWAAVTVAPYVASLVRLDPDVTLIAGMPALIKLHLLTAIAIVAILPYTTLARVAAVRWNRIRDHALVPVLRTCVPLWRAVESTTLSRARLVRPITIRDRGEEN